MDKSDVLSNPELGNGVAEYDCNLSKISTSGILNPRNHDFKVIS